MRSEGEPRQTMSTLIEGTSAVDTATVQTGRFLAGLDSTEPIRADLYGLDHLQTRARDLAQASAVTVGPTAGHPLLRRFVENGRHLVAAHEWITELTRRKESITPDAEWLLDNFHIVEDTLREIRVDLPRGYYRKLPKLSDGPLAGYPRVYV